MKHPTLGTLDERLNAVEEELRRIASEKAESTFIVEGRPISLPDSAVEHALEVLSRRKDRSGEGASGEDVSGIPADEVLKGLKLVAYYLEEVGETGKHLLVNRGIAHIRHLADRLQELYAENPEARTSASGEYPWRVDVLKEPRSMGGHNYTVHLYIPELALSFTAGRYTQEGAERVADRPRARLQPTRPEGESERHGYVLAMAVLQSDLWKDADDALRAAVERFTADHPDKPNREGGEADG